MQTDFPCHCSLVSPFGGFPPDWAPCPAHLLGHYASAFVALPFGKRPGMLVWTSSSYCLTIDCLFSLSLFVGLLTVHCTVQWSAHYKPIDWHFLVGKQLIVLCTVSGVYDGRSQQDNHFSLRVHCRLRLADCQARPRPLLWGHRLPCLLAKLTPMSPMHRLLSPIGPPVRVVGQILLKVWQKSFGALAIFPRPNGGCEREKERQSWFAFI